LRGHQRFGHDDRFGHLEHDRLSGRSAGKEPGNGGKSEAKQSVSGGGGKQSSGGGNSSKSPKAHSRAEVSTPLKVSGGGSGQLRVKGGDNSIQEFGEESSESELQEAAEAVHGFFVARGTGEWEKACSYMSASLREQFEQLGENKNCAAFLEGFTTALPASTWREITTIDAGSLRHDGEQAFLIYYGAPGKTVYAMPMKDEGGEWKVGALSGNALPRAG
jgi:hypothetical protein